MHVFGGHTSPLLQLYWRLDLDMLVVKCLLGEVYFWELSTGILERKTTGQTANELLSQLEGMASYRHTNFWYREAEGGSNASSGHGVLEADHVRTGQAGGHPPVCVLNVNVSQLLTLVMVCVECLYVGSGQCVVCVTL